MGSCHVRCWGSRFGNPTGQDWRVAVVDMRDPRRPFRAKPAVPGRLRPAAIPARLPAAPSIRFPIELAPALADAGLRTIPRPGGFDIALRKGDPEVLVRVTIDREGCGVARALLLAHGRDPSVRAVALNQLDRVVEALRNLALNKDVARFAGKLNSVAYKVREERDFAQRKRAEIMARTGLLLNPEERRRSVRTLRG